MNYTLFFWIDFCSNLNDFPLMFCFDKITNVWNWGLTGDSILVIVPSIQILLICWLKSDCLIVWLSVFIYWKIAILFIVRLCNIIRWPVEFLLLFHRLQMERLSVQKITILITSLITILNHSSKIIWETSSIICKFKPQKH